MGVGVFLSRSSQDGHPQGIEAVRELEEKDGGEEYSGSVVLTTCLYSVSQSSSLLSLDILVLLRV